MKVLFPFFATLILCVSSCVNVPTTQGNAVMFGVKADVVTVADATTDAVVFQAQNFDQTVGLRYARDSFVVDRFFNFFTARSANRTSVSKAQIDSETTQAIEREATSRALEEQITRRSFID